MAKFVFRVQAALDLRRKQEDEAKQVLAAAETRRSEAAGPMRRGARRRSQATVERATDAERQPGDVTLAGLVSELD